MSETTPTDLAGDFGSNEWLVEELYEKYKNDKNSVDKEWWPFFEKYEGAPVKSSTNSTSKPASQTSADKKADKNADSESKPKAEAKTKGVEPSVNEAETTKAESKVASQKKSSPTQSAPKASDDTAEDVVTKLRGPAKLIAENMDASLEVPTATSVRSLPAKALIDNRIVINSHLRRTRGGKVSFTHLIGFAVIRALKAFPSQNVYYEIRDGKPVMVQPAHVNFGLAIDIPKKDGTR